MIETKPKMSALRVPLLFLSLCLLLVSAAYMLPTDPLVAARLNTLLHRDAPVQHSAFNPDSYARFDIPMGVELPQTGAGISLRKHTPPCPKGYLMVALGDCASCIRFDFARWEHDSSALHVALIGFTGATPPHIAEYRHDLKLKTPIYFDKENNLSKGLNAYWNGRVYYFDSQWRLAWQMQGSGNPDILADQPGLKQLIERQHR